MKRQFKSDRGRGERPFPQNSHWQQSKPRSVFGNQMDSPPRMSERVWESSKCRSNYDLWKIAWEEQKRYRREQRAVMATPTYESASTRSVLSAPVDFEAPNSTYNGTPVRQPYYRSHQHLPHIHQQAFAPHRLLSYNRQPIPYEIPPANQRFMTNAGERVVKGQYSGNHYYPPMLDAYTPITGSGMQSSRSSMRDLHGYSRKMYLSRSSSGRKPIHHEEPTGNDSDSLSSSREFDKLILRSIMSSERSAESKKPSKTSMMGNDTSNSVVPKKRGSTSLEEAGSKILEYTKADYLQSSNSKIKDISGEEYNPFGVDLSDTEGVGITLGRVILGDCKTPGVDLSAAAFGEHFKDQRNSKEYPRLVPQFG